MKKKVSVFGRLAVVGMFSVGIVALGHSAASVDEGAGKKLYFNPSETEMSSNWKEIKAQQAAYVKAKEAGDFVKARSLSMWHFQKAWLYFNEAMSIIGTKEGWLDETNCKNALTLMDESADETRLAEESDPVKYSGELKACSNLVKKNRKIIEKQIAALLAD